MKQAKIVKIKSKKMDMFFILSNLLFRKGTQSTNMVEH